jgi:hypothetical protein
MSRHCVKRTYGAIVLACVVVAGCFATAPGSPAPDPTVAVPSEDAAAEAEIKDALRFRTEFGLRADDAFVRQLRNDPAAVIGYGIPMLPAELEDLQARADTADAITNVVDTYAATVPDAFGGQYIESTTGTVYALFLGDLAVHRAALSKLLRPSSPLELMPARYSERALNALMAAFLPNQAWLKEIGAPIAGASLETSQNRVWLMVSGDPPGGFEQIYERFRVATDMLRITVEDRSLAKLPRGALRGQLIDDLGLPVHGLFDVRALGDLGGYEPDAGTGISTNIEGTFFIERLAEMGWTIEIIDFSTGKIVGSAHAEVVGGETAHITITVDP